MYNSIFVVLEFPFFAFEGGCVLSVRNTVTQNETENIYFKENSVQNRYFRKYLNSQ